MKGASMFASAGIGETYFEKAGINIVVANELLQKRADFYQFTHEKTKVIVGDISEEEIKRKFIESIDDDVDFLVATPPCQGLSTLGVNKQLDQMQRDPRNYLVFDIFDVIDNKNFEYILIENVPRFLTMFFPYNGGFFNLEEIIKDKYENTYNIDIKVLNAKDYGVPQSRPRAIIKMYKKNLTWSWPNKEDEISLREAIGHLPTLESGEISNIKYHYAKIHNERDILCMKNTPSGCSAMVNDYYYPKKKDGTRIKGFHNTYKRMDWEKPAPARTMNSGNIGSHNNVHPGVLNPDGTYSDARVLSLKELFIVSSLPDEWNIPINVTDNFIRQIIGEAIPPLLSYKIVSEIKGGGK